MPAVRCYAVLLLAAGLAACSGESTEPDVGPLALPTLWTFDGGSLEGWTLQTQSPGAAGGTAVRNDAEGYIEFSAWGDPGVPNAWMSRQVTLPDVAGLWIDARAISGCAGGAEKDSAVRMTLTRADGTTSIIEDWNAVDSFDWPGDVVGGSLDPFAGETVTITIEQDDEGEQEESAGEAESLCVDDVTIFID